MSKDLKRKWVNFNKLEEGDMFTFPDSTLGVEHPYIKLSKNTYGSVLNRIVYFPYSDNMQVDISIMEKQKESDKSN